MGRPRRHVDGRLTLLALALALLPQAGHQFDLPLATVLPPVATNAPVRALLAAMGLLYIVTLLLVPLETRSATDGSRPIRVRIRHGVNLLLRLAQGLLGTVTGLVGGLVVTQVSGLSQQWQTTSLWLATLLLALIVTLPYLTSQLERRGAAQRRMQATPPSAPEANDMQ
jgi:hypothetical protein